VNFWSWPMWGGDPQASPCQKGYQQESRTRANHSSLMIFLGQLGPKTEKSSLTTVNARWDKQNFSTTIFFYFFYFLSWLFNILILYTQKSNLTLCFIVESMIATRKIVLISEKWILVASYIYIYIYGCSL
jgi:hypothetical protein